MFVCGFPCNNFLVLWLGFLDRKLMLSAKSLTKMSMFRTFKYDIVLINYSLWRSVLVVLHVLNKTPVFIAGFFNSLQWTNLYRFLSHPYSSPYLFTLPLYLSDTDFNKHGSCNVKCFPALVINALVFFCISNMGLCSYYCFTLIFYFVFISLLCRSGWQSSRSQRVIHLHF